MGKEVSREGRKYLERLVAEGTEAEKGKSEKDLKARADSLASMLLSLPSLAPLSFSFAPSNLSSLKAAISSFGSFHP